MAPFHYLDFCNNSLLSTKNTLKIDTGKCVKCNAKFRSKCITFAKHPATKRIKSVLADFGSNQWRLVMLLLKRIVIKIFWIKVKYFLTSAQNDLQGIELQQVHVISSHLRSRLSVARTQQDLAPENWFNLGHQQFWLNRWTFSQISQSKNEPPSSKWTWWTYSSHHQQRSSLSSL